MRRIVYSPKAYVYILTEDGTYNISDLVVSGSVTRRINQVSSAEVTFQNPYRTFTKPGEPTFRPMDRITIFLQRLPSMPVHVFSGYLDDAPYYQMYPGVCTVRASCTLKKLEYTWLDPGLPFFTRFMARYGWYIMPDGTIEGHTPVEKEGASSGGGTSDPTGPIPSGAVLPQGVHDWVLEIAKDVERKWGPLTIGGYRVDDYHEHDTHRTLDIMVPNQQVGDEVAKWILDNREAKPICWLIWRQRINHGDGWVGMEDRGSPTENHMDHVHVIFKDPDTGQCKSTDAPQSTVRRPRPLTTSGTGVVNPKAIIAARAAYKAGFRGDALKRMVAIAGNVSSFNATLRTQAGVDDKRGLWQINVAPGMGGVSDRYPEFKNRKLSDPFVSAKTAKQIYDRNKTQYGDPYHSWPGDTTVLEDVAEAAVAVITDEGNNTSDTAESEDTTAGRTLTAPSLFEEGTIKAQSTMSDLLFACLEHIAGIDAGQIRIEELPEGIIDRIRTIYQIEEDYAAEATAVFEEWINAFVGNVTLGSGGSATGGGPAGNGVSLDSLSAEQNRVLDTLMAVADRMKVPEKYRLAAIATGLVESNLRELRGGDQDSQNWRQERESGYGDAWAKTGGSNNTTASATRYYNECKQQDEGQSPGELAADVQRPREDLRYKYGERMEDAKTLLQQYNAKRGNEAKPKKPKTTDDDTDGTNEERQNASTKDTQDNPDKTDKTEFHPLVKGTAPTGWPGSGGAYGAPRSYGAHAGVDVPSGLGDVWYAACDGEIVAKMDSWAEGSGLVVLRPTVEVPNYPKGVRLGYGGTQSINVDVGDKVTAGQGIAKGGTHGSGPHLHFFMATSDSATNGSMDPTPAARAFQRGEAPTQGSGGGGTDTAGSYSDEAALSFDDALAVSRAGSVFTSMSFPGSINQAESTWLTGSRSLMNDQPLLPFIDQLCKGTLRSYQSLPNGDFYAWHPDYFGNLGTAPYWEIDDIEIMDGNIQLSDKALVTHSYVVGQTVEGQGGGQIMPVDISRRVQTRGVVTVFTAGNGDFLNLDNKSSGSDDSKDKKRDSGSFLGTPDAALKFLQRYGARPALEDAPFIRSHAFETFYAYQNFMLAWSRQFLTTFTFTFMPEIYPGGIVEFKDHGIQMYVEEVTHSFDYSSGFTTQANMVAPAASQPGNDKFAISRGMVRGDPIEQTEAGESEALARGSSRYWGWGRK